MRVLMLGWEYPPYVSGGLGKACQGLTQALGREGVEVTFVLPQPNVRADGAAVASGYGNSPQEAHAGEAPSAPAQLSDIADETEMAPPSVPQQPTTSAPGYERIQFRHVPVPMVSGYQRPTEAHRRLVEQAELRPAAVSKIELHSRKAGPPPQLPAHHRSLLSSGPIDLYAGDLFAEAKRYAQLVLRLAREETFDLIHAHDWLTFPAALALAEATGKPMVVHLHSTEVDRAGEQANPKVMAIEQEAMRAADRVLTVSHHTRRLIEVRYGIYPEKVEVVHNGIDLPSARTVRPATIHRHEKVVLFLGRVTAQKGPAYFVQAAKRVVEKYDRVKFVMAGSGDQIIDMIDLAIAEGIGNRVLFTGFLDPADVDRVFRMADVFVMPSVSEPFGLSALEALSHDVPVIVSRTAGVTEVIKHALTVDFWNVDDIADKIIAVLRHPSLAKTLRENADVEVRQLSWDESARRCLLAYEHAVATRA